ncbi:MAG: protein kinase [Holophagales bacterium]|nr:protein kinase [Holophagales bacterium]
MALREGDKLGPYEVSARIGAGGMGEVWRARDTRLGRDVAIKILTRTGSSDADRIRRFEVEMKAVGRLSHPNVLAVFDVGSHEGSPYLVSELLEGETLRDRLDRGPLPARFVATTAVEIAQGLAAAHAAGVVHRDLKPENVFVTRDGRIKLLDFGLAKLVEPRAPLAFEGADEAETAARLTVSGVVVGTVRYMSPEQIRGAQVDHRSDIFAFGALLFEMLTGEVAFRRPSAIETLSATLADDPLSRLEDPELIPVEIEPVLKRCLEKKPENRFQSAADLAFQLGEYVESVTRSSNVRRRPRAGRRARGVRLAAAVGLAVAILGVAGLAWRAGRGSAEPGVPSYRQLTFRRGLVLSARFSPGREDRRLRCGLGRGALPALLDADGESRVPSARPAARRCPRRLVDGRARDLARPKVRLRLLGARHPGAGPARRRRAAKDPDRRGGRGLLSRRARAGGEPGRRGAVPARVPDREDSSPGRGVDEQRARLSGRRARGVHRPPDPGRRPGLDLRRRPEGRRDGPLVRVVERPRPRLVSGRGRGLVHRGGRRAERCAVGRRPPREETAPREDPGAALDPGRRVERQPSDHGGSDARRHGLRVEERPRQGPLLAGPLRGRGRVAGREGGPLLGAGGRERRRHLRRLPARDGRLARDPPRRGNRGTAFARWPVGRLDRPVGLPASRPPSDRTRPAEGARPRPHRQLPGRGLAPGRKSAAPLRERGGKADQALPAERRRRASASDLRRRPENHDEHRRHLPRRAAGHRSRRQRQGRPLPARRRRAASSSRPRAGRRSDAMERGRPFGLRLSLRRDACPHTTRRHRSGPARAGRRDRPAGPGRDSLARGRADDAERRLLGLQLLFVQERPVPRHGSEVRNSAGRRRETGAVATGLPPSRVR